MWIHLIKSEYTVLLPFYDFSHEINIKYKIGDAGNMKFSKCKDFKL